MKSQESPMLIYWFMKIHIPVFFFGFLAEFKQKMDKKAKIGIKLLHNVKVFAASGS